MTLETMTKISTVTVGAGTDSSITFNNIPQTYTDLIVKVSGHLTGTGFGAATIKLIFNSSTSGYSWRSVLTDSAGGSYSQKGDSVAFIEAGILPASQLSPTLNVFGIADMLISNYASNNSKAVSIDYAQESGSVDNYNGFVSGIWVNTAPITSLTITPNSSNFSQYSTFTLYGVKSMRAASGNSIKATGGSVKFDGTYVTHTFNTSGSFTPTANLLVDYLVVAGGGGGGGGYSIDAAGGGGGAGGLRSTVTATGGGGSLESKVSCLGNTSYAVTVGAGGSGGTGAVRGTNGSDSSFFLITSTGGGGGGMYSGGTSGRGLPGGSGGGGGNRITESERLGGAGTANQGYAGATGSAYQGPAGGGGGAGAAATDKNGATGVAVSITGSSVIYAGGGGAGGGNTSPGTGGSGGGGVGNANGNGTAGFVNTGGGGGGASTDSGGSDSTGGTGSSGIVIIRYKG